MWLTNNLNRNHRKNLVNFIGKLTCYTTPRVFYCLTFVSNTLNFILHFYPNLQFFFAFLVNARIWTNQTDRPWIISLVANVTKIRRKVHGSYRPLHEKRERTKDDLANARAEGTLEEIRYVRSEFELFIFFQLYFIYKILNCFFDTRSAWNPGVRVVYFEGSRWEVICSRTGKILPNYINIFLYLDFWSNFYAPLFPL